MQIDSPSVVPAPVPARSDKEASPAAGGARRAWGTTTPGRPITLVFQGASRLNAVRASTLPGVGAHSFPGDTL